MEKSLFCFEKIAQILLNVIVKLISIPYSRGLVKKRKIKYKEIYNTVELFCLPKL